MGEGVGTMTTKMDRKREKGDKRKRGQIYFLLIFFKGILMKESSQHYNPDWPERTQRT